MLSVTINERPYAIPDGRRTILDALHFAGIDVPALCDDPRLAPTGACRLCVVEVAGERRPVVGCSTPLADGMAIRTHTQELEQLRRTNLRLLAQRYPLDAIARCPDKPFHRYLREYGLEGEAAGNRDTRLVDASHPYLHVDMSQCIHCYRCVRICDDVQGQDVWRIRGRGDRTRIVPDSGTTLKESSCVACGACAHTCPTGAIEDNSILAMGKPERQTRTTCPYCGTGCEMNVGTRDGRIVSISPVLDAPVNKGHLCVKGRYAFDFNSAADRITRPMLRQAGDWQPATWEEASAFVAQRLRQIVEHHGAESVAVLSSARATNEENYVAQKFARVVLGTNNVDCCARVCHAPSATGMIWTLGTGAATSSFDDIERARTIVVCGANPTENHPVVGARIKQAARRGANLIVIDPRRIELAEHANIHLQLRPGSNVVLLNALAHVIVDEELHDKDMIARRVSGWEAYKKSIAACMPEDAAAVCEVDAGLIRQAARLYAGSRPSICFHGLGITEHVQGTESVACLVNLSLLTGNIGIPGAGINPLRGQNNVQGAAHMGCEPSHLTGYVPLDDALRQFESYWRATLPRQAGLNLMEMIDRACAGHLKAMWAIGYDVAQTNPELARTRQALGALDLLVVQDLFLNETAREFAHVFFPAASSFEKDGTFMNSERRVQRVRAALDPVGECRADWQIICNVARRMGRKEAFEFQSAREIWDEIRSVWPAGRGITYARLDREGGLQWPCPTEDHPGTPILHAESFAGRDRAPLTIVGFQPSSEEVDAGFPFLLNTGRTLYHFNAGTMTARSGAQTLQDVDVLEISPPDAEQLGLQDGQLARVINRYGGETTLPIRIVATVRPKQLFATFHSPDVALNVLIGPGRDRHTNTPQYKVTAVRVERV